MRGRPDTQGRHWTGPNQVRAPAAELSRAAVAPSPALAAPALAAVQRPLPSAAPSQLLSVVRGEPASVQKKMKLYYDTGKTTSH